MIDASQYERYVNNVSALIQDHSGAKDYFVSLKDHHPTRLESRELSNHYNTDFITAAFRVPERSVRTSVLADYYEAALKNHHAIDLIMNHTITSVAPAALEGAKGWTFFGQKKGIFFVTFSVFQF